MKIFINTAGTSRELDYAWYEVADGKGTSRLKTPEIVTTARERLPIDLESFGVLLVGGKKPPQVLVTSIPSRRRQDSLGRTIRTSLLIEADLSEYKLEQLLIHAFGAFDEFRDQVDQFIDENKPDNKNNELSFRRGEITQLLKEPPSADTPSSRVAAKIKSALNGFPSKKFRHLSRSVNESGTIDVKVYEYKSGESSLSGQSKKPKSPQATVGDSKKFSFLQKLKAKLIPSSKRPVREAPKPDVNSSGAGTQADQKPASSGASKSTESTPNSLLDQAQENPANSSEPTKNIEPVLTMEQASTADDANEETIRGDLTGTDVGHCDDEDQPAQPSEKESDEPKPGLPPPAPSPHINQDGASGSEAQPGRDQND